MWNLPEDSVRARIANEIYTYCAFCVAVSALPALALSYMVVRLSKHLWLKLLSSRYPRLEFIKSDTVRSLLDTHRNQGIINVLLSVNGTLNVEEIKHHLTQHVIDKRDNYGDLMFPRLRHVLVSCWGNYAWDVNIPFRTENHLIIANGVYRGRTVTDANIQEYISEIISKYFPNDQPPWQYIIIPCASSEPKYYILVRVHHLLLTGKKSINIGDMLLVTQIKQSQTEALSSYTKYSPLAKLTPHPSAIPELWSRLNEHLSNLWNEFISEYDPVESPRALKTLPGVFHVAGLVLIAGASAIRELRKKGLNNRDQNTEPALNAKTLILTVQRECKRRNLTVAKVVISPLITVDPRKWPQKIFKASLSTTKTMFTLPFRLSDELLALYELKKTGLVRRTHTYTWRYAEVAQLLVQATGEAWRGILEAYRAPATLWSETIRKDDGKRHLLQTVNLCGRKVTSWSRPIPRSNIERAAHALGVSSTDISLFAATEALRTLFEQTQGEVPDQVLTTARAASEDFLFTFAEGYGKKFKKSQTGGMICLALPVGATPRRIASVVEHACKSQSALAGAWAAQARFGLLTRAVPSPFARLTLNLLSRRYAVSYAEINALADAQTRTTTWGQNVDYVVYWRPPQANISLSLTVIQYADTVRLAVMADARLAPAHITPANRWPAVIEQLVNKIDQELARIAQTRNIPTIITTQVGENEEDNEGLSSEATGSLRPPTTTIVSPPPIRRQITQQE